MSFDTRSKRMNFCLGFASGVLMLVVGAGAFLGLGLLASPADREPSSMERWLLTRAVRASVERRAPKVSNPLPATEDTLAAGGKRFLDGCAGCHETPLKPVKTRPVEAFPMPPDLPHAGTPYSDAEAFYVIKHGVCGSGMSAWGPFYSDQQIWELVTFVKRADRLPDGVLQRLKAK